jgi:hypothetical protein
MWWVDQEGVRTRKLSWQERADALRIKRVGNGKITWEFGRPVTGFAPERPGRLILLQGGEDLEGLPVLGSSSKVLELGPRLEDERPLRLQRSPDAVWHYAQGSRLYGVDTEGRDVLYDASKATRTILYSANQRESAVSFARRLGPSMAARKFGIPLETVRSWMKRRP